MGCLQALHPAFLSFVLVPCDKDSCFLLDLDAVFWLWESQPTLCVPRA
jgi:hypothetical protein